MGERNKVAFITGASRGIGKACAIELAEAGFDIAITARTVAEGEAREHSSTLRASDTTPLPGSLASTAELVEKAGARCMQVAADLMEPATVAAATTKVLERWGGVDVVVHNGRYIGPGHMDRFLDTPLDILRKHMEANLFAPLVIDQIVLPQMIARGSGTIVDITSGAAYATPAKPAGAGGWGMGYAISKGAFHRVAGILKTELAQHGVRCFNLQPGYIATERIRQDMAKFGFDADDGSAPPAVPAKVVRWLCTSPEAEALNGENIEAQQFCHERGLLLGWKGPTLPKELGVVMDLSGYHAKRMLEGWAG
jgi:NAD(P)-dependent dehydrogenase (short-subunit alcohol dehydrogenase family)